MVNILYAVTAFTCSLVSLILPMKIRPNLDAKNRMDAAFLLLIRWTAIFCFVDGIWGVTASDVIINDTLLVITSTMFHLSAAFTPVVWLNFVLAYLENVRFYKAYTILVKVIFLLQAAIIFENISSRRMFGVNEAGEYTSTSVRRILFYIQYFTYILIGVISIVQYLRGRDLNLEETSGRMVKKSYKSVLWFVAAPILTGIFQMLYPDAPAYSIGYMLGCCIIYSFVLTDMLNERVLEQAAAQAASSAKTAFLFNMSHDIRTPLNAITGFTAMAKKSVDDRDKLVDYLEKIDTSGEQLLNIINQILEMSRIESGKSQVDLTAVSIKEKYEAMAIVLSEQSQEMGIDFMYSLNDIRHDYVLADDAKVSSIILNVAGNAMKYTQKGGIIEMSLTEIDARCEGKATYLLKLSDNGIGMSEEYLKVLFEPFTREKNSTVCKVQGTGLGMSIVKNFVDLMGGDIEVKSAVGVGTRFLITLDFEIASCKEKSAGAKAFAGEEVFDGMRVLLVEDNELNREIAEDILAEKSIAVETAENGKEAVDVLRKKGASYYGAILMDIQMPVMNGYEATAQIRRMYPDVHIPIIALSANAFAEDKEASLKAGMDGHVAKPINIDELFNELTLVTK